LHGNDDNFEHKKARIQKKGSCAFSEQGHGHGGQRGRLGFTKAELFNPESNERATQVTLAESQPVKETRERFEKAGIGLVLFDHMEPDIE
jgi:hypothetical protein